MGLKVCCFAGFCHHPVSARSPHTYVYYYPLFESKNTFMNNKGTELIYI